MIKTITVTNPKNESLVMELTNPWATGLNIKNVDGLGPPKANISSNDLATVDGSIFTGVRSQSRSIVFTIGLLANPDVEVNRLKTYRYFPLKKKIKIAVETDNRKLEIEGWVESNEPDIFSEDETATISILCLNPWFYKSVDTAQALSSIEPMFEFPFSNESTSENLIQFGEVKMDKRAIIHYEGDIDTGVRITAHMLSGGSTNLRIFNTETREMMTIRSDVLTRLIGGGLEPGDDIIISTYPGEKFVKLLRNGLTTNIIAALDKNSDWLMLTPGDNVFSFDTNSELDQLIVTFQYKAAYGGI